MKGDLVISHTSLGAVVRENHFKAVNDTARHAAGDAVLAAFGTRLTAWAGPASPPAASAATSSQWS